MASITLGRCTLLLPFVLSILLFSTVLTAQCNTNQNPYCAGNNQFEQLCCTYPSVCYWSNRNGDPACCPAGSDCSGDGGPVGGNAVTQVQATTYYAQTTYSTTVPQASTVTYYSQTSTYPQLTSISTVVPPAVVVYTSYVSAPQLTSLSSVITPAVVVYTSYASTPQIASLSTVVTPAVVVVTSTFPVVQTVPSATGGTYVTVTEVQVVSEAPSHRADRGFTIMAPVVVTSLGVVLYLLG